MPTFLALNERDFTRMNLTTKMIKLIEKLQAEFNDETADTVYEEIIEEGNDSSEEVYQVEALIDPNNPYEGINLEKVSYYIAIPQLDKLSTYPYSHNCPIIGIFLYMGQLCK